MINWVAIAKWRDELRSGKYKQTRCALRTDAGYCCMGVFCEGVAKITPKRLHSALWSYENQTGILPVRLSLLLGASSHVRIHGRYAGVLNDNDDHTFDEIADLLDIAILEHELGTPDSELIT